MLGFMGQALIYIVPFLIVMTFIVTIHELGHFLTAKAFKVKIERFSIGFGRAIYSRTDRSGVEWRMGWLPLGGYVKFAGDLDATGVPDKAGLEALKAQEVSRYGDGAEKDLLYFKPLWQRALIVAAGPMANFVLAIVIFTLLFSLLGVAKWPARVGDVQPNSPAAAAGFVPGDVITHVNGRLIDHSQDVTRIVSLSSGDPVSFTVERQGQDVQLIATPERRTEEDPIAGRIAVGRIGLVLAAERGDVRFVRYNPIEAVGQGVKTTWSTLETTVTYLGRILTGRESGDMLSGPVGMTKASGALTKQAVADMPDAVTAAKSLALTLVQFAAILSIGIGFLNLLPIPVLDGGHLMFYAYEAIARRPVAARVQEAGYRIGLALLVSLMLFATWNDIQKLNVFKFLGGLTS